jgi:D-alanine-D-alanine ligase
MGKGLVTKKKIGVLMGGQSSERDVSMRSGLAIYQNLHDLGYNPALIDVGKDIVQVLKKEKVKLAFLALHGGVGENGAIQGLLEVLGISCTGSGVLASALAMDKEASKKIFSYHGLPVAPFFVVKRAGRTGKRGEKGKRQNEETDITGEYTFPNIPEPPFELPWVVKPAAEGSSIGVSIVKEINGLAPCLEKTFSFGRRVIVEKFIRGKEVHVYEAKYTSGFTDYIIPPEIDEITYENTRNMALRAHRSLGCSGVTRVDFMIDENNSPYILEVNTLPGMTATSLLPKIAKSAGLSFNDLIEEIIRLALKE